MKNPKNNYKNCTEEEYKKYNEMIGEIINIHMKYNFFNVAKRYVNLIIFIVLMFMCFVFTIISLKSDINTLQTQIKTIEQIHTDITYRR